MLRYRIIDKVTGESQSKDDFFVTQDGVIAWADGSGCWSIGNHQERWCVELIEYTESSRQCSHLNKKSIRRDRQGNLFECQACGLKMRE